MEKNPLISVIVPVYKVEKYLEKCINSIINQTYKNLEIILIDDGSPDNCGKICDEFAEKDNRIKVIHKENGGVSTARNMGLDIAKGDFISFVDSDDFIHKRMFELLLPPIIDSKNCISVCELVDVFEKDFYDAKNDYEVEFNENIVQTVTSKEFVEKSMKKRGYFSSIWNKLYHKDLFSKGLRFTKGIIHGEDMILVDNILMNIDEVKKVNLGLYFYTIRSSSLMNTFSQKSETDVMLAYINEVRLIKKKGWQDLYKIFGTYYLDQFIFRYEDYLKKYPDNKDLLKIAKSRYREMYRVVFSILDFKNKIDKFIYYISPSLHKKVHK